MEIDGTQVNFSGPLWALREATNMSLLEMSLNLVITVLIFVMVL